MHEKMRRYHLFSFMLPSQYTVIELCIKWLCEQQNGGRYTPFYALRKTVVISQRLGQRLIERSELTKRFGTRGIKKTNICHHINYFTYFTGAEPTTDK
jgi:hypothetical protein